MWFGAIVGGLKALTGFSDAISDVSKALADARIAAINAKTDQERIAAQERARVLEIKLGALEAEAKQPKAALVTVLIRGFMALPVGILMWKLLVYDKALGQWTNGTTDALSPELWQYITAVVGFYFLYEGVIGITRLLKR